MSKGQLDAFKLFKVFRALLERQASGILRLEHAGCQKDITFTQGLVSRVDSTVEQDSLGWALVNDGLISSTEYEEVKAEAMEKVISFTECLTSKDLVAVARLSRLETKLARKRVVDAFGWAEGQFSFRAAPPPGETLIDALHPVHLIIEACAKVVPTPVCRRFIDNFKGQIIEPTSWTEVHRAEFESMFPSSRMLHGLAGGIAVSKVNQLAGEQQDNIRQVAAVILGGLAAPRVQKNIEKTGAPEEEQQVHPHSSSYQAPNKRVVRPPNVRSRTSVGKGESPEKTVPKVRRAATTEPVQMRGEAKRDQQGKRRATTRPTAPQPPRRPKPVTTGTKSAPKPSRAATAPEGKAEIPSGMPPKDRGFLEEAIAIEQKLKALTYFELIGVERTASTKLIRHEFRKLARKFHVDRFSRYDLNEATRSIVQRVFIALNRAHETLTDADLKKEYELTLEYEAAAASRNKGANGSKKRSNESHLQDALQAEKLVQVAVAQLARGEAAPALERLNQALSITPDDPSAVAGKAFATYLISQSHGASKTATMKCQDQIRAVIKKAPHLAQPHYYLARTLRDSNELDAAIASYEKSIKLDPHLSQAVSELRYTRKRKEESASGLKGLFGRKK
ncbi:MAG: DUF4388 domain-containing protein [Bradymonadia bacterium]